MGSYILNGGIEIKGYDQVVNDRSWKGGALGLLDKKVSASYMLYPETKLLTKYWKFIFVLFYQLFGLVNFEPIHDTYSI